jgi:hypothetical protein
MAADLCDRGLETRSDGSAFFDSHLAYHHHTLRSAHLAPGPFHALERLKDTYRIIIHYAKGSQTTNTISAYLILLDFPPSSATSSSSHTSVIFYGHDYCNFNPIEQRKGRKE